MKLYQLKTYPHSVLRKVAEPVIVFNSLVNRLIKSMFKIMYSNNAVGMAATQVGELKRIIIVDIGKGPIIMANPEIITGYSKEYMEEGCLSLSGNVVYVARKKSILVKYLDKNEEMIKSEFNGLTARVIQHEIDHLNGVLIIDHAPPLMNKLL